MCSHNSMATSRPVLGLVVGGRECPPTHSRDGLPVASQEIMGRSPQRHKGGSVGHATGSLHFAVAGESGGEFLALGSGAPFRSKVLQSLPAEFLQAMLPTSWRQLMARPGASCVGAIPHRGGAPSWDCSVHHQQEV